MPLSCLQTPSLCRFRTRGNCRLYGDTVIILVAPALHPSLIVVLLGMTILADCFYFKEGPLASESQASKTDRRSVDLMVFVLLWQCDVVSPSFQLLLP